MYFNKEVLRQLLAIYPVYISNFVIGSSYAWPAPNIKYLLSPDSDIPLTSEQSSWVASLLHIGRFFGPILGIALAGKHGRKFQLVFSSICFLCSCILIATTRSVFLLCLARFICGYAVGVFDGTSWIYMGEITSSTTRGVLCSSLVFFYYLGITFEFLIGMIFTYQQAAIFWICAACGLLFSMYNAVETPYYLLSHGRNREALAILSWLRALPEKKLEHELADMESHMIHSSGFKEFLHLFKRPEVYKSFIINITLGILCSLVAVILNTFATFIFPASELMSSDHFSVFFGVIQFLSSILSWVVIGNFARKMILVVSFGIQSLLLFSATALIYMKENSNEVPFYAWFIFSTVSGYMVAYSVGTFPVVASLRAELYPTVVKELGTSVVVMVNATVNFTNAYVFFAINNNFGMHVNFFIFFLSCVFGIFFSAFVVPETSGKSLEEIQDMLSNKSKQDNLKVTA